MEEVLIIAALTLVAAVLGTVAGFGTSTVLLPVLVILASPVEAIFLVGIIHWFGNVWKVVLFRGVNWKLVWWFGGVGLVASFMGAWVSVSVDQGILLQLLGFFLVCYGVFLFFQKKFHIPTNTPVAVSGGVVSGFFAGLSGLGGALRSAFVSAFNLPKASYLATLGMIGLLVDSTRIITYATGGARLPSTLWWGMLLFIPLSFVGAEIGKKIIGRIPQERFRQIIAVCLVLIGLKLIIIR